MIGRLKAYFLENFRGSSFLRQKQADSFFYYVLGSLIALTVLLFAVTLLVQSYLVFIVPLILSVMLTSLISLFLLRAGWYDSAVNILTAVLLLALITGTFMRLHLSPGTIHAPGFYLLFIVIMQAALFCSRRFVIAFSAVILIADLVFYLKVREGVPPDSLSIVRISAIYVAISVFILTYLSQLFTDIFNSALKKLEAELTVNVENFLQIENLHRSSEKLQQEFQEVKEVSLRDALTGLRNRRFLDEVIAEEVETFVIQKKMIVRNGCDLRDRILKGYGLIFADIDHFKTVNDRYGHRAGDMVLQQFSFLMSSIIRKDDVAIRWGGEEFLMILKNTKRDYLPVFAEKARAAVEQYGFSIGGGQIINLTCSIGFSCIPYNEGNPDSISMAGYIALADQALYYSKTHGRNRWTGVEEGEAGLNSDTAQTALKSFDEAVRNKIIRLFEGSGRERTVVDDSIRS